jgi:hypothetical protein
MIDCHRCALKAAALSRLLLEHVAGLRTRDESGAKCSKFRDPQITLQCLTRDVSK